MPVGESERAGAGAGLLVEHRFTASQSEPWLNERSTLHNRGLRAIALIDRRLCTAAHLHIAPRPLFPPESDALFVVIPYNAQQLRCYLPPIWQQEASWRRRNRTGIICGNEAGSRKTPGGRVAMRKRGLLILLLSLPAAVPFVAGVAGITVTDQEERLSLIHI